MKKKVRLKKTVKRKFLLFVILAVIMTGLIVGELTIGQREVKDPAVERLEAKISETTTQEEPQEETTEEETTVETTAPETVPETTASAPPASPPPVPASAADFNNPQTVDPNSGNWELTLVNAGHKLPDGYVPSLANAISGSSVQLDSRVVKAYQEMYDAAKKDGCVLTPYAGYCSVSRQNDNYNRKVSYYKNQGLSDDDAAAKARTFILPGGYSEQNLGLSMDIVSASSDFASTKEFSWLVKNAQDYGFILRYPENKTDKTGMNYQPWHWRYVGKEAAKAMNKSGLCLEEYLKAA